MIAVLALFLTIGGAEPSGEPTANRGEWPTASWPDGVELSPVPHATQREGSGSAGPYAFEVFDTHVRLEGGVERVVGREVIVIGSGQGLDQIGDLTMTYVPAEEELLLIHLKRRRPGSDEWEDLPYRVQLAHAGKIAGMYVDERTVAFIPEGIATGDVIDFAYLIRRRIADNRWSWRETDEYGAPVARRRLVVDLPESMTLSRHEVGFSPMVERVQSGRRILEARLENIVPSPQETWLPAGFSPHRVILLSSTGSWEELNREYAAKLESMGIAPQVAATARRVASGGGGPVSTLASWVQTNVRYVGIETESHKMFPAAPAETLTRGYGDCKDMSLLLVHLLRSVGVDAWPAMVRTEDLGPIQPEVPTLSAFNHEIVAVKKPDGLLFIDPTVKEAVPPWSGAIRPGAYALVANGEGGLVKVEPQPDDEDGTSVRVTVAEARCDDGGDGCLRVVVTSEYVGPALASMRRRLLESPPAVLEQDAAGFFAGAFPGRTLVRVEHDYSRASEPVSPLVIEETFLYGRGSEGEVCRLRFLPPEINEWFSLPSLSGRRSPLGLAHPRRTSVTLSYDTAQLGDVAEILPWRYEDRFLRMTRTSHSFGDNLLVTWTAETIRDAVPVDELIGFASAMNAAAADSQLLVCTPAPFDQDGPSTALVFYIIFFVTGTGLGLWAGYTLGARRNRQKNLSRQ